MNHYQPRSKGTWGREDQKTSDELNRLCNEFFEKLVVPTEWKDMGWNNVIVPNTQELYSVGKIYRDLRTSGMSLMHYRIYFNSYSCRGGICERSISGLGKKAYKAIGSGIFTIEKMNLFIHEKYTNLKSTECGFDDNDTIDKNDGLQHFRDRFTD